jgi:hypothetical protein
MGGLPYHLKKHKFLGDKMKDNTLKPCHNIGLNFMQLFTGKIIYIFFVGNLSFVSQR